MSTNTHSYRMEFDTVTGPVTYRVDIDDDDRLEAVIDEILWELRQKGKYLKGSGEPQVTCDGKVLDFSIPVFRQADPHVDVLKVSTIVING